MFCLAAEFCLTRPATSQASEASYPSKMHLNGLPLSLLVAISSLCSSSSALPFLWKRTPAAEALPARPTYSVVPIDGSGGQGSNADTTLTVTVTSPPTTVIESSPPITETVTVSSDPTTRTISIIDIEPTTQVVTTTLTPTPTLASHPTKSSIPTISTSNIPSTAPTSSSPTTSSLYYPTSIVSTTLTITPSFTTSTPVLSWATGSSSYDDGHWHTTYPAWNGTFTRRFARHS